MAEQNQNRWLEEWFRAGALVGGGQLPGGLCDDWSRGCPPWLAQALATGVCGRPQPARLRYMHAFYWTAERPFVRTYWRGRRAGDG
jgi:hypothetical protein